MWLVFEHYDFTDNKNVVAFSKHYLLVCQCINSTRSLLTSGKVVMPNLPSSYHKGTLSVMCVLLVGHLLSH